VPPSAAVPIRSRSPTRRPVPKTGYDARNTRYNADATPPEREVGEEPESASGPVSDPVAPVVTGDLIVAALGDRRLRAVTRGGETEWTRTLDREVVDLVGGGGMVVAATHDPAVERTAPSHGRLAAFDIADGLRRWTLEYEDHVENHAVAGGTVYVTRVVERDADGDVIRQELLALS
jgi:outer membrane protein assembly factor BamB